MDFRDKGIITQLSNIEAQLGRPLASMAGELAPLHASAHAVRRRHLMDRHGLSHVHADTLLAWLEDQGSPADLNPVDTIYAQGRSHLRPIHDAVLTAARAWGSFEVAPKKGYVSLRRRKQFAMVGPTTRSRVDIGLNLRGVEPVGRLRQLPPGRLCQMEMSVVSTAEVDAELLGWLGQAFEQAE